MAEQERKTPGGIHDAEEIRRKRKSPEPVPEKLKAQGSEVNPFSAILESPMGEPSVERHAALLGDARFSHPANAEQKARMVSQLQQNYGNAYVQRVVGRIQTNRDEEVINGELPGDIAQRIASQRGRGQPLSPETTSKMEESLGHDLSNVRVHTDAVADRLAKKLGARAFTTGKDVFFREGAYEPDSETGKRLLGHELTHVVQESGPTPQFPIKITDPSGPAETEAEMAGHALSSGKEIAVMPRTEMAGAVARQPVEVIPEEEVVEIHPEAAPAKPPEAMPAPPMTPAQKALRTLWLTAVYDPLCDAINVLVGKGSARWKAKEAHKSLERSRTALRNVAESYKDTPQYDEMVKIHLVMAASQFALEPYFGARMPMENITKGLNAAADHVVLLRDKL